MAPKGRDTTPRVDDTTPSYPDTVRDGHVVELMMQMQASIAGLSVKTDRLIDDVKTLRESDIKDLRTDIVSLKVRLALWTGGIGVVGFLLGILVPIGLRLIK